MLENGIMKEKPNIIIVQETNCDRDKMISIAKKSSGGCETMAIGTEGFSVGLSVLWNRSQVIPGVIEANRLPKKLVQRIIKK